MKLLFDENLSHKLAGILAHEFPGCAHVRDIGLRASISSGKLPDDVPLNTVVALDMTPGPWNGAAVRVWPAAREAVPWPPPVALQDTGEASLDGFCDRWGEIEAS